MVDINLLHLPKLIKVGGFYFLEKAAMCELFSPSSLSILQRQLSCIVVELWIAIVVTTEVQSKNPLSTHVQFCEALVQWLVYNAPLVE